VLLLIEAVSAFPRLVRLRGLVDSGEVPVTLCRSLVYSPLIPPLTNSFAPCLALVPASKSLKDVKASDLEAVVCMSSRACESASLSIGPLEVNEATDPLRERKPIETGAAEEERRLCCSAAMSAS